MTSGYMSKTQTQSDDHARPASDGSVTLSQQQFDNLMASLSRAGSHTASNNSDMPNNNDLIAALYRNVLDLNKRNASKPNLPRDRLVNFFPESTGKGATPDQIMDNPAFFSDFENRSLFLNTPAENKFEKWMVTTNQAYLEPSVPRNFVDQEDDGKFLLHDARFLRMSCECPTKIFSKAANLLQCLPGESNPTLIQSVSPSAMPVNAHDLSAFGLAVDIPAMVWTKIQKMDKTFQLEDIIKIKYPNKQSINIRSTTQECFYWALRIFALVNRLSYPWDMSSDIFELWLASRSAQTTDNAYRQICLPRTAEAKIILFNSWWRCRATRWQQKKEAPDDTKITNLWDLILTTNGSIMASSKEAPANKRQPKKQDFPKPKPVHNRSLDPKYSTTKWAAIKAQCEASATCYIWNMHNRCARYGDSTGTGCVGKNGDEYRSHKCVKCGQPHRFLDKHSKDVEK